MATDLNINPYYDDFDEFKNFHQILFRPGYAVQARELTQLQTIIQDQIKKFGTHIFQQGSVVIPGNSFSDLYTPYVKLETSFGGQEVTASEFSNAVVVGVTSGVRAIVRKYTNATSSDPLTFFVTYLSGGGANGQYSTFIAGEEIYSETDSTKRAVVKTLNPTGYGSMAFVKSGVFFVNGRFVTVDDSSIVISKYDSVPSCRVLFKINEEIVTSNDDSSLLDPASGSYNFAAPGADRLKISLELTSLPLATEINDNYIEIMRFNQGVLEEHARYPKYSELEKSLARRTYDESGDYVVNGFKIEVKEHLKTKYNDGVYTDLNSGDRDKFVYKLESGKAYIKGFEVEKISTSYLSADKARTPEHVKIKDYFLQPTYGQYLYVTGMKSLPNFNEREEVQLYSSFQGGTQIGTMRVYAIDLLEGDATQQTAVYKLYYHDVKLSSAYKLHNAGRIAFSNAGSAKILTKYTLVNLANDFYDVEDTTPDIITDTSGQRKATVHRFVRSENSLFVFRHDPTKEIPLSGDFVTGSNSLSTATINSLTNSVQLGNAPLLELRIDSLKSIKNAASSYADLEYVVWQNLDIETNASGNGTAQLSLGTFLPPDAGILVASAPSGIVSPNKFSLTSNTILALTNGPANTTVKVLTQVKKQAIQPKSKVLTALTLNNVTPSTFISLGVCDVYKIVSITDGDGNNITRNFSLDNGQRDYYYDVAKLKSLGKLPETNLTIVLEYFAHVGSGDFFSVDSYSTLGSDYIGKIPEYRSTNTSKIYDLRVVLDFRPKIDPVTNNFSGGGASGSTFPVIESIITTPTQYFIPRIDSVVLNKDGDIFVVNGFPSEFPVKPLIPSDSIELYSAYVPPYTDLASSVVTKLTSTRRYTMKDIAKIETRVNNIERLSVLNSLENSVVQTEVIDAATGLNRFKSGYLVDNFTNPFLIADNQASDSFSSFYGKKLGPRKEGFAVVPRIYQGNGSINYQLTNNQLSLPYTEKAFIEQKTSTKYLPINPFSTISWEGVLTVGPEYDLSVMDRNKTTEVATVVTVTPAEVVTQPSYTTPVVVPPPPQPVIVPPVTVVPPVVEPEPILPTYSVEALSVPGNSPIQVINETDVGETSVKFQVTTENVSNGTVLYYNVVGDNFTSSDLLSGSLSGTITISSNSGSVTLALAADTLTEGTENFTFFLKNALNGTVVASKTIRVEDTSRSPATYSISQSQSIVTEGASLTFTITTTNVPAGSAIDYEIVGNASDFTTPLTGTINVGVGNTATLTVTTVADSLTEGPELVTVNFNRDIPSVGYFYIGSAVFTISDTSLAPSTYQVTSNKEIVNEGSTVTFTISTTSVPNGTTLYYTLGGPGINGNDLDLYGATPIQIQGNTAQVTKTILTDSTTEGPESLTFYLRTSTIQLNGDGSNYTPNIVAAKTVIIEDISQNVATATISSVDYSDEGNTITFTINTTNFPNGTTLYYQFSGTGITSDDFTDGLLTNSFQVTNNTYQFSKTLASDGSTENSENLVLSIKKVEQNSEYILASKTIVVYDTPPTVTYYVTPSTNEVNEGSGVFFAVTTTNVPNNTALYYTITGTGVTTSDVFDTTGSPLEGQIVIVNNSGNIFKLFNLDSTSEGPENFTFNLKTGSTSGPTVASATILVRDTSLTPVAPTYTMSPSVPSINEGQTVTFNITTTNVANSTTLYYEIYGNNVTAADFVSGGLTGSVTVNSNTASFSRQLANDSTTEFEENVFLVNLKTAASGGTIVAVSSVSINDTSQNPATYQLSASSVSGSGSVGEGEVVTFTLTTTNVSNGTVVYYRITDLDGNLIPNELSGGVATGSVTVTSNSATFTRTINTDNTLEGLQFIKAIIRTVESDQNSLVASCIVNVIDKTVVPATYTISVEKQNYNEGETVVFAIATTNVANGTTLYWNIGDTLIGTTGSISSSDINGGATSGSVTITNNQASVSLQLAADLTTEGTESFRFYLKTSQTGENFVGVITILVTDSSQAAPPPPSTVTVQIFASNLGQNDLFVDGSINDTLVDVKITETTYNSYLEMINGPVYQSLSDIEKWATRYAAGLATTTLPGTEAWTTAVYNAISYLESEGYSGTAPGGQIYELLDSAYNRVTGAGVTYGKG